jgi:Zn-dependent protease
MPGVDPEGVEVDEERIARIVSAVASAAHQAEADDQRRILAEVEELSRRKSGWLFNIGLLAVSVALFFTVGRFTWGWHVVLLILIVVLVHEAGHYAGMKLFGYSDVSMFFIPFFGGAVSGRSADVPGWKRALVALMGPVPGLALGIGCVLVCRAPELKFLSRLGPAFLLINGFNLLPFYPLDGGHLLNEVVFCRSRYLALGVRVLGGLVLALAGLLAGYWVLIALGCIAVLFSSGSFKIAGLADRLRGSIPREEPPAPGRIPPGAAAMIIAEVRAAYPYLQEPRDLAFRVDELWEQLRARPPGWAASLALLAFYGALLLLVGLLFAASRAT